MTTRLDTSPQLVACLNLLRAATVLERRMTRQLVHGLALPELLLLLYLRHAPDGRLRRVDLAERLGMSQSSVTRMLGPLERRKIVARVADERDSRAVLAALTDEGIAVVDDALASAELAAGDLLDAIDLDDVDAGDRFVRRLVAGVPGTFRVA